MSKYTRICIDFGEGIRTAWAKTGEVSVSSQGLLRYTDVETENRKVVSPVVPYTITEGVELPDSVVPWDGVKNE